MYVRFLAQMMINTTITMFIITEIASNTPSAINSPDLSSTTFQSVIVMLLIYSNIILLVRPQLSNFVQSASNHQ